MNLATSLAVARAKRKAAFNVTWSIEALCKGSCGAFCRQTKTQDKSHLGVRDLCTSYHIIIIIGIFD